MMDRILRHPSAHPVPFSRSVEAGGFVFLSGQLSMDAQGNIVGEDIRAQTKNVLDAVAKSLEQVGCNMADVVRCTVWLSDFANFAAFNEEYRKHFPEGLPARSTVEAKLFKGALVEIEVQALAP
jgi:reactive intermediate/imine deaminase